MTLNHRNLRKILLYFHYIWSNQLIPHPGWTSNPLSSSQNVNNEDVPTSAEQGEEGAFLDAVMESAIMQEAYNFLSQTSKSSE